MADSQTPTQPILRYSIEKYLASKVTELQVAVVLNKNLIASSTIGRKPTIQTNLSNLSVSPVDQKEDDAIVDRVLKIK
ncbi:hypothetical protein CEXT_34351 [Caerostris extrusa]|uniref:Uncharacterized protein n=1 Tax=Caerostris extrusa TaxID=172846 RepID=A0AAV4PGQ8_CAEEX|nr:hypothetical protein CEXT_34351 [Caerostris extrusa]